MKIPRYWAKATKTAQGARGKTATFSCWEWSEVSVAEARQKAEVRAERIARKLLNHEELDRYGYGTRPLREEICESIKDGRQREVGLVTRNVYGALILNTANAMFIDIDFPPEYKGLLSTIRSLFGKPTESQEDRYLREIQGWAAGHPDVALSVYRTYGGLRCLVTNQVFDPAREETLALMRELPCDPLYVRLCKAQGSFRARLTPKPWRCGLDNPPSRYPWEDRGEEQRYRNWEGRYTRVTSNLAACRLLTHLGSPLVHPEIEPIKRYHDRVAGADAGLNLA